MICLGHTAVCKVELQRAAVVGTGKAGRVICGGPGVPG